MAWKGHVQDALGVCHSVAHRKHFAIHVPARRCLLIFSLMVCQVQKRLCLSAPRKICLIKLVSVHVFVQT